jgi:hypothetical protein
VALLLQACLLVLRRGWLSETPGAELAFLSGVGGLGVAPPAPGWDAIGLEIRLEERTGPVRLRPRELGDLGS